jgi:hypothetical protein
VASASGPAGTGASTSPDATSSSCPSAPCGGLDGGGGPTTNPGTASTPVPDFVLSDTSPVQSIRVKRGGFDLLATDSADLAPVLTVTGATACIRFDAVANYSGGTASVNWTSATPSLIAISPAGDACLVATDSVRPIGVVPITATATGSGLKTFTFLIKIEAPASAAITVN